jgi:ketosteroid isomerase-like protein
MNLTHVQSFTAAMQDKNLEAMLTHMAEDIVLNTPLAAEPVKGKAAVRQVVGALLGVVDSFDFREIMQGPQHIRRFSCSVWGSSGSTAWISGASTKRD